MTGGWGAAGRIAARALRGYRRDRNPLSLAPCGAPSEGELLQTANEHVQKTNLILQDQKKAKT